MGALVGATGTSTADVGVSETEMSQLDGAHDSRTDAVATIENHGGDLLTTLSDQGLLPAASVAELDVESLLTNEEHIEGKEGLFSSVTRLDQPTSRVTLRKYVDDKVVKAFVHPEAGDHYAIVHSKDSYDDVTLVDPEDTDGSLQDGNFGTEAEYVGYSCENLDWTCSYTYYPWFADDSGCYRGDSAGCCNGGYRPPPC